METLSMDMSNFQKEFSMESLKKRMSERLARVRRMNHPEENENRKPVVKEEQRQRQ